MLLECNSTCVSSDLYNVFFLCNSVLLFSVCSACSCAQRALVLFVCSCAQRALVLSVLLCSACSCALRVLLCSACSCAPVLLCTVVSHDSARDSEVTLPVLWTELSLFLLQSTAALRTRSTRATATSTLQGQSLVTDDVKIVRNRSNVKIRITDYGIIMELKFVGICPHNTLDNNIDNSHFVNNSHFHIRQYVRINKLYTFKKMIMFKTRELMSNNSVGTL